uniref:Translation initiation factor IF2/IF5 domain-containing protein n=1 Tax=viral metagenome TaxID=1070528 RepID=A0A6C0JUZ6_9ZZZZ
MSDDEDFDFSSKKKKVVKKVTISVISVIATIPRDNEEDNDSISSNDEEEPTKTDITPTKADITTNTTPHQPSSTSIVDNSTTSSYTYEFLLERVFEMVNLNKKVAEAKFRLKPPRVEKEGTKKTQWKNFTEMCVIMNRPKDHVQQYVLAELGCPGSINGAGGLIIKGKFIEENICSVVKHYLEEYVFCHSCKSGNTNLLKQERLFFLSCSSCSSRITVATLQKPGSIKKKFEITEDKN